MSLPARVDNLSEREVEACLQGVLKGFIARKPEYTGLFRSPDEVYSLLHSIADQLGDVPNNFGDDAAAKDPRAMKLTLRELASDSMAGPWVEAWLDSNRPTLLEPVTTAVVLASIVMVLSVHIKLDVESKNGKTSVKVHVEKKPTAKTILMKFLGLF